MLRAVALACAATVVLAGCEDKNYDTITICEAGNCYEAPRTAQSFDPASAVPDPDPEGRLPVLIAEAEQDPRAAYDLGVRYMRGDGIRRNPYEALKWMRDAGERGDARAQSALGRLYLTGLEEMGPDYNEAALWLGLAAQRGDAEAGRLLREAEAQRADEAAFQTSLRRWQELTRNYWYRGPYYGYWRTGYRNYYYY